MIANSHRKLLIGNWKMQLTVAESVKLAEQFSKNENFPNELFIGVAPSFSALAIVANVLKDSSIKVGAQTVSEHEAGAFTAQESAKNLALIGATFSIIGHSETRLGLGETDTAISQKIVHSIDAGLTPILCIGESLKTRKETSYKEFIKTQLDATLVGMRNMDHLVIAYEPLWAISTEHTHLLPSKTEIEEIVQTIKDYCHERYDATPRVLYGGSVNAKIATELSTIPELNGFLVGQAALNAKGFESIAKNITLTQ